jgi:hypothetical protein
MIDTGSVAIDSLDRLTDEPWVDNRVGRDRIESMPAVAT